MTLSQMCIFLKVSYHKALQLRPSATYYRNEKLKCKKSKWLKSSSRVWNPVKMRNNLNSDMLHQRGEKTFNCMQCNYSCTRAGHLKTHMLTHSGEKPFSCTQCDYTCTQAGNLKSHMRKHSGEKPYSCTQCKYSCAKAVITKITMTRMISTWSVRCEQLETQTLFKPGHLSASSIMP